MLNLIGQNSKFCFPPHLVNLDERHFGYTVIRPFKIRKSFIPSNLDITNKSVRPFLFTIYRIIHYIKCNMLSKSSKRELALVHYIAKFTKSRVVISRFGILLLFTYLHSDCIPSTYFLYVLLSI